MKLGLPVALACVVAIGCAIQGSQTSQTKPENGLLQDKSPVRKDKVVKTDAEWKRILTPEQYRILRHAGTEAPFCTPWHATKKEGDYVCAGCKLELFKSTDKFESGTGWPSFMRPYAMDAVWIRTDTSHNMVRKEALCARCDGHLGHVFDDGPAPTGLRWCINAQSLYFRAKGSTKLESPQVGN